jgi:simple sugar transport system permease protein
MIEAVLRRALRASGVLIPSVVLVAVVAALVATLTAIVGYDPRVALGALWRGSLGTQYAVLSATLVRATPLILTGLAVALAFTAGLMNIGAEGQLLAGATVAVAVGLAIGHSASRVVTLPLELVLGGVAGAFWAFIPAWWRQRFGVLEVISTIMMNFVALYLVGYLVRGPLQEPLHIYPQSETLPVAARLPALAGGMRLHWGFPIVILCAVGLWWALRYTAAGFRVRVLGINPEAAVSAAQIDAKRTAMRAFLVSGGLAGLAGAIEVTGVTYSLYENLSPGYGYTAIAVALVGALNPLLTAVSGIVFGALEAGAAAMQRDAGVPSVLASVVEASIILLLIAFRELRVPGSILRRFRVSPPTASENASSVVDPTSDRS